MRTLQRTKQFTRVEICLSFQKQYVLIMLQITKVYRDRQHIWRLFGATP